MSSILMGQRKHASHSEDNASDGSDKNIVYSGLRGRAQKFIRSSLVTNFIVSLIVINAVILGLQTSHKVEAEIGTILHVIDQCILWVFVAELTVKAFVHRLRFFHSGWRVFDFVIVGISLVPSAGPFTVLRTLRVLRVLRLISVVPAMRRIVHALFHAVPAMGAIVALTMIIFYVSAVLTTELFGSDSNPDFQEWFGTIGASMFTLFQVMTLEGWAMEIVRPVMEVYPWAWAVFVPFIMVTTFAVLNLFIGIIVDAMQIIQEETEEDIETEFDILHAELIGLREEIKDLKEQVKSGK